MKTRFNTYDIICSVAELQKYVGMRVNQVYDIDNKNYLIRLQRSEEKCIILLESGNRFHTTAFEWPKNMAPSGFSMKMRKHLKNKRLEKLSQLGIDRVVDFQFGTGEAAYHVILELYDRGNIVLTDYNWVILNVLRPHTEGETVRFAVREKYPLDRAKERSGALTTDKLLEIFSNSKPGDTLKKILNPHVEYGPAVIDHTLSQNGLAGNLRLVTDANAKGFFIARDMPALEKSFQMAEGMITTASASTSKGYIIQKKEERPRTDPKAAIEFLFTNQEFHPFLYSQYESLPHKEFDSFDQAVDEFFSTLEGQKIDIKAIHIEREAMKKLQNVRKDHDKRLTDLTKVQANDRDKAELITRNQELVDNAILAVQSALANQLSWNEINSLIKAAQKNGDTVALTIKQLKLDSNHMSLMLKDPYISLDPEEQFKDEVPLKPTVIDVDLGLSAYANARRYFDQKRSAAKKQQKTIESHGKALKSAEKKTMQTLKEVQTITNINKARKVYWFEKFYWFISSENFLVIGGRDQQQNEILVKRYMRANDIYVHADLSGASSIIIKNPSGSPVPPKTLNEAGQMAVSYSIAWEAKVVTSAWWVNASQVSKSAPSGEYLTTGSFMIRGKKNFLPPCHLTLGFSFMFRLEESSIARHMHERKVIVSDEFITTPDTGSIISAKEEIDDQEIEISDDEDDNSEDKKNDPANRLDSITEETAALSVANEEDTNNADESDTQSDAADSDSEDDKKYPNTHIRIEHDTGKITMKSDAKIFTPKIEQNQGEADNEDVVFLGDDKPIKYPAMPQKNVKKAAKQNVKPNVDSKEKGETADDIEKQDKKPAVKRGQHGKLNKRKKYKDQDVVDKEFFMEYFKPDGVKKESKRLQRKGSGLNQTKKKNIPIPMTEPRIPKEMPIPNPENNDSDGEGGDAEPEAPGVTIDTEMLCQLTGQPVLEDELLFAVPVIAPYAALHNYKYKVKLTPGTGKRGKAARTVVQVFLRDKACSPREKDLLKAVKDENLARNLPGKVKLSAPQLQKHKK